MIRSFIDTTTFIIYDNIDVSKYGRDFDEILKENPAVKGADFTPIFNALTERDVKVRLHEQYHYWQGLRLPFVYAYANECFRQGWLAFRDLSNADVNWKNWVASSFSFTLFERLDREYVLVGNSDKSFSIRCSSDCEAERRCVFSAKELLECAASVFDWQKFCEQSSQQPDDPLVFRRWRKRNPAYFKVLDFLTDVTDSSSMILKVILPLINAAFHTSLPERAFCDLLNRFTFELEDELILLEDQFAGENPYKFRDTLQSWLKDLDYDVVFPMYPEKINLEEECYYFLEPEVFLGGSYAGLGSSAAHPILSEASRDWQELATRDSVLAACIDFPGLIPEGMSKSYANMQHPDVRVATLFFPSGETLSYPLGNFDPRGAFGGVDSPSLSDSEARGVMLDLIVLLSALKGVVSPGLADSIRRCHHVDCQYFAANFCSSYPFVPKDYRECMFPEKLTRMANIATGGN